MKYLGYLPRFIVMKNLSASFFAILLSTAAPACLLAQEPASSFGLTPSAKPESLLPESAQGGLPLIPEGITPTEKPSKRADGDEKEEKKSKTTAAEDALRDKVKLRVAKTKAQSEPDLQAIWDSRLKAKTDYEQRQIMDTYYKALCERIMKFDKTLSKETINSLRERYLSNYDQSRIAKTVPPEQARAAR